MIKEGQQKTAKYWGNFTVKKVVQLAEPVACYSQEKGEASFEPTLVQIEWERPPSDDNHEFYFPYWITFEGGKQKYGQSPAMMGETSLLELLQKAIRRELFSENFLDQLRKAITGKLNHKQELV